MNFSNLSKKLLLFSGKKGFDNRNSISVFGLGKVGTAIAAVALENGLQVYGFDIDEELLKTIGNGEYKTQEPEVASILAKYKENFKVFEKIEVAISYSHISIVIVPTPSTASGNFSSDSVELAVKNIVEAIILLAKSANFQIRDFSHSIIIASTVSPETIRTKVLPLLESLNVELSKRVEVIYSPEFIALGSVIYNLRNPEYIILGHRGNGVTKKVIDYKKFINTNRAPIHITSFESAEIAKISVNTFLTTKISYANMLSNLIHETSNAAQAEVFNILRDDSRIGKKFFSPGLGYGGPCLPRDNRALIAFGKAKNVSVPLASATDEVNENQPQSISNQVQDFIKDKSKILFLGVTYKAGTNSAEESHALRVINSLKIPSDRLVIHDFYYDFEKDSNWSMFDTFNSEFLDCDPDGIVCFLNDKRYLKFLEAKPEQIIYRAYDLSIGKNS